MKTPLLAAAIVLVSSLQAFGQSCGCDSHPVMTAPAASYGCNECCHRCERPLLELAQGIGFTLKNTACTIKNGVSRLFHPITYYGCNSCSTHAAPSCGCGTTSHSIGSYEMMEPGVEYIESTPSQSVPSHPQVPTIPGPPTTPTSPKATEPSKLQTPRKWEPVGSRPSTKTQVTRSGHSVLRPTPPSTTRPVTYYAPSK